MLKISDSDWAFKVLPAFTGDNKDFANQYWEGSTDIALGMYGLTLRHKQLDDSFYRLSVCDPQKWMLTILRFGFEVAVD